MQNYAIDQRPEIVELKQRLLDFKSDLIIGKKHKGTLLIIADRYSVFVLIENVNSEEK